MDGGGGSCRVASVKMRIPKPWVGLYRWGIAVALILTLTGGHWLLLQSFAWVRMIVTYARSATISTALAQTFDGQHPCPLCKLIQKAQQSSKQQWKSCLA